MNTLQAFRDWRLMRKAAKARLAIQQPEWSAKIAPKVLNWIDPQPFSITKLLWVLVIVSMVLGFILGYGVARAEEVNLDIIATIESSNNPLAYNATSHARGLYQITPICLKDYNFAHKTKNIASNALYSPTEAHKVAEWYILRIKQILTKKGIPVEISHILISYNWGVGNCIKWYRAGTDYNKLPRETRNYIAKYLKLARSK